ncbi:MAG TPA: dTDP-glucose 4,6-dehydratase [Terriglobales bacterium]|jgi:dTDP-glucose 4,6-dehydratase|nr:dTDP-glucose 4,6-dehydratase [Terriglobales bacterium]
MKILVTGGAGFIGSNFIRHMLQQRKNADIVNFDKLTYSGNLENLADIAENSHYQFIRGDITDAASVAKIMANGFDAVINFAAETHVDRSIENAAPFFHSNVMGTLTLLEAMRRGAAKLFIQISTDEVYGSAGKGESFSESQTLDPRSPYSASKAAADHLVNAYIHTYGVCAIALRCTNNYGPYQFPEKLIPLMIANALEGKPLPVYGDGMQERDWLYVEDYCRAITCVLEGGKPGDVYNVSSGAPTANLTVIKTILKILDKPESLIQFVTDRPGHDRRYSLDSSKLRHELGWKPEVSFDQGIRKTVDWYLNNKIWMERARSGEYRDYYDRHYTRRDQTFSKVGSS